MTRSFIRDDGPFQLEDLWNFYTLEYAIWASHTTEGRLDDDSHAWVRAGWQALRDVVIEGLSGDYPNIHRVIETDVIQQVKDDTGFDAMALLWPPVSVSAPKREPAAKRKRRRGPRQN